ncbi:copper chaperone PCu(A)C [Halomonas sp. Mc5H-6]|jgi:copper(I)-binding protein|uniref:copper chaperone PCu(A)C n=1 Tax=Halomonas sp. Mc5H-6 TaxID=2954500 RepID=UPI002097D9B4|nr:copper chaperone PCu(A)C [Halomonas sp. Mc5H-6]MCO7246251.1 copper chaperone PCu(A)C [Halomonas sp. Mc5H-6]
MVSNLFTTSRRWIGGLAVALLTAGNAYGQDVQVTDARVSLLPGEQPGAGYFQLYNAGDEAVILVGAESDAFENVELHVSSDQDGMAHMHAVEQVEIAPGERFAFAPKGHHLMLIGRQAALEAGDEVDVRLEFSDEQRLSVTFDVVSPAAL